MLAIALASGCLCSPLKAGEGAAKIALAADGQTACVIALARDHSPPEQHAAQELARFLKQATGAEFAIVAPEQRGQRPAIAVGPGAARQIAPDLDLSGLGQEGIVIQSRLPDLILTGGLGASRGTLYAVYTFLEDAVGCRWWTKTESSIPRRTTLVVPELKERYVPPLEYREPCLIDASDPDWAVRNKCNGNNCHLDEARGGGIAYRGGFVHTLANNLVPSKEFFPKHPEWFSEIGGNRVWAACSIVSRTRNCWPSASSG